jgi:hypothetical protein
MPYVSQESLANTIDSVSLAIFIGDKISKHVQVNIGKWLASRQGLTGSYAGMFAPTNSDFQKGIRLFTGERVTSRAAVAHILGEESCRILSILNINDREIKDSQDAAINSFASRLNESEQKGYGIGTYCCGKCSTAYWRNLLVTKLPQREERLVEGIKELRKSRMGDGRWRIFPFHYVSLVLTEMGPDLAKTELQYAAPVWEKFVSKCQVPKNEYARRRLAIGQRLLVMC